MYVCLHKYISIAVRHLAVFAFISALWHEWRISGVSSLLGGRFTTFFEHPLSQRGRSELEKKLRGPEEPSQTQ